MDMLRQRRQNKKCSRNPKPSATEWRTKIVSKNIRFACVFGIFTGIVGKRRSATHLSAPLRRRLRQISPKKRKKRCNFLKSMSCFGGGCVAQNFSRPAGNLVTPPAEPNLHLCPGTNKRDEKWTRRDAKWSRGVTRKCAGSAWI